MSDTGTPQTATVTVGERTAQLPILSGTEGVPSVDFSTFTKQTGHTALDYGSRSPGCCSTAICRRPTSSPSGTTRSVTTRCCTKT